MGPHLLFGIRVEEGSDIKESQWTKGEIEGFRKIGDGQHLHNVSCIVQKLLQHGKREEQQQQPLVKIGLHIPSPAPYEKQGYENSLDHTHENYQVKHRYKRIRDHTANV